MEKLERRPSSPIKWEWANAAPSSHWVAVTAARTEARNPNQQLRLRGHASRRGRRTSEEGKKKRQGRRLCTSMPLSTQNPLLLFQSETLLVEAFLGLGLECSGEPDQKVLDPSQDKRPSKYRRCGGPTHATIPFFSHASIDDLLIQNDRVYSHGDTGHR